MVSDPLLQLIGDTHMLDLDEFRLELLAAVGRAVPSDLVSLNDVGPDPADTVVLSDPAPQADLLAAFTQYAHQNPLVAYHGRTLDGRPWRFSDMISRRELHALDLYTKAYAKLGVEFQIAFTLPNERGRVLGIALSRRDHDFSDAERDLLADARPFLIQSYRNAIRFTDVLRNPAAVDSPRRERLMGLGLTGRQGRCAAARRHRRVRADDCRAARHQSPHRAQAPRAVLPPAWCVQPLAGGGDRLGDVRAAGG